MKLYTFYTSGNERLLREWFLPTFKDDYPVIAKKGDQGNYNGIYKNDGWFYLVNQKIDFVIKAVRENWNEVFIFSDPDIQFFDRISQHLSRIYKKQDLLFQQDTPQGMFCTGFFICRGNSRTLSFWQDVKRLIGHEGKDDQDAANYLLTSQNRLAAKFIRKFLHETRLNKWYDKLWKLGLNNYRIKLDYLPSEFYSGRAVTGKPWTPGMSLSIPEKIILHHANWTFGMENKIEQLKYVRDMVNLGMRH